MISTATPPAEQRYVFYGLSWEQYEGLLRVFGERRLRHTYAHGTLEIMSPSKNHEWSEGLIHDFVTALCRLLRIPRQSVGSMTMRREDLDRGLEPDEGFYIGEESIRRVGHRRDFDPDRDPPPDLVAEVDITHSSLNRMDIYRRLGVPEIWRYDGETMTFYGLTARGYYRQRKRSRAFPFLAADDLTRFLAMRDSHNDTELEQEFERWVRRQTEGTNRNRR